MSFFVTSRQNGYGDLGGLDGADATCTALATAVGAGNKTWHAYLSGGTAQNPVNARDRIGAGPWYNAKGVLLAQNLTALHARSGDAEVFLDEHGTKIPAIEHDILTGSDANGNAITDATCDGWTSSTSVQAEVGHSDGLADSTASQTPTSWNAAHLNFSCGDTAPPAGAGRFYCFALN
jgi:hypothetical protein